MKVFILKILFLIVLVVSGKSQNTQVIDNQKFIEVTGRAEIAFIPDQITYAITINDDPYTDVDEHLLGNARALQTLMKSRNEARYSQVWEALKSEGINENAVVKNLNYNINNQTYTEFEAKAFVIKMNSFSKFQKVVEKLKATTVCSGQIIDVQSNKIQELEDKVKILAIENATKRAEKWTLAANSKVGKVLQIKDVKESFENSLGKEDKGEGASYPPYASETYFVMGNIESTKNGEFVVKQAVIVRFLLEN